MNVQTNDTQCSLLLESNFAGMQNNKILDLSLPLLLFATRLSKIHALDDDLIVEIRDTFANQVLAISGSLSAMHCYDEKDLIKFRYCLCVFIDEMLLRNESIMNSDFTNHTLTNRLFNEMLGGDKFYGIAGQYLLNPSKYKDMLEFIYACLILGYKGKYTVDKQGDEK
ncbi:type IVB secretion system protein IcmH/DotU, partial [Helicobacter trogontum]